MIPEDRLAGIAIFSALTPEELGRLAAFAEAAQCAAGDTLLRQGDFSTDLYVIEDGVADVIRDGEHLGQMGAGDVVGEIGVVGKQQRTADVVAKSPLRLIRLNHWEIKHLSAETRAKLRALAESRHSADGSR